MSTKPKTLSELRSQNLTKAISRVHVPVFAEPRKADNFLPVMVTGGIGDLIVALPLIDRIIELVGAVKIFCNHHDVYRYFRPQFSQYLCGSAFPGYDYWMRIETVPRFFLGSNFKDMPDSVQSMFAASKIFQSGEISRYVNYQPQFDGELWAECAKMGFKRHTVGAESLGLKTSFEVKKNPVSIDLEPFITCHDGFDVTQKMVPYRSTKSWNLRHWGSLIKKIKNKFPTLTIVQLGGPTSRPIPGVDVDFSGRLRIEQSFNVLSRSLLHIDGDSGLVHAGHAMGVRSVAMFGSTPSKFFGYDENINIDPKTCGGCGWMHEDWMNFCGLYDQPVCMDSILPEEVFEKVEKEILGNELFLSKVQVPELRP